MAAAGTSIVQLTNDLNDLSKEVTTLREDLSHTRLILQALCRLLKDSTGVTEDQLSETIAALEKELENTPREAEKCPSCDRALQDRAKACIYCGEAITTRRLF